MGFMKKYFFTLFSISFFSMKALYAYDGIVIVLEAPLLKSPDLGATVLQTIRKGQRVFIPQEIGDRDILPEFVPTFDRAGNRAYIPSRYIKVITGTDKENYQPITIAGHDPTDYRLEEPIPVTYPFEERNVVRTSISFLVGNSTSSPYAYNSAFNEQNYGTEMGGRLTVTRNVAFDKYDRFYFGFIGLITSAKNSVDFKNSATAEESRGIIRGGPWLTFDAFKNETYRLSLGSGFTFNYHRTTLFVDNVNSSEERIFSGFSISPLVSTALQVSDLFPNTDFVGGVDFSFYLPHSLQSKEEPEIPELWGDTNQITSSFKTQVALFLGFQIKY